ncbi:MAG: heme-binding protein [Planctomycetota bacterium]|nr:heme-binding protein [Planctomycetota bacterium]
MTRWVMNLSRRRLASSVVGMLLVAGLAGCITSQSEMDRLVPRTLGRAQVRAQLRAALDDGRQLRQAGKGGEARELYEATCRRLSKDLGPRSDAACVLSGAMEVARANADDRKAIAMLEAALVDAIAAEDFSTVVSGRIVEGFPEPSPIGAIRVKHYPAAREAAATCDGDRDKTFNVLFAHLHARGMEMTSPVVQTHAPGPDGHSLGSLTRIAFYYEKPSMGAVGADGAVLVADIPPVTVVCMAVRGEYTPERLGPAVGALRGWLASHADRYTPVGEPRVLVYSSTVIPAFMRYAEVQIPVRTK